MLTQVFENHVKYLFKRGLKNDMLCHAAMGVAGEAGELVDAVKKSVFYGKPLDAANVLEECGDLLFYVSAMLHEIDETIDSAMRHNIIKLQKRYPQGYSNEAAIQRADKNG